MTQEFWWTSWFGVTVGVEGAEDEDANVGLVCKSYLARCGKIETEKFITIHFAPLQSSNFSAKYQKIGELENLIPTHQFLRTNIKFQKYTYSELNNFHIRNKSKTVLQQK